MEKDLNTEKFKDLILDSLEDHVIYFDRDLRILYANKAVGKAFNLSLQELIGKNCYALWHKRNSPCNYCPVKRAMETGKMEERDSYL